MSYHGHADQKYGSATYSQHGEDLVLLNIFDQLEIKKPSWLDVGAHHPINISNTKLLYDRGGRGINVEANSHLIAEFKKQRPEDLNLNIGIGVKSGVMDFYMYDDWSGRNTFSIEETKTLEGVMDVRSVIKVPVITINMIVDKYCKETYPDLLSVDIEGLDYDVLENADFSKSRPRVIIVETRPKDTLRMSKMLNERGFDPYCRMGENLIFVQIEDCQKIFQGV